MLSASHCKVSAFRASRAPARAARLHVVAALKVGDKLPDFTLKTDQNTTISSQARLGKDPALHNPCQLPKGLHLGLVLIPKLKPDFAAPALQLEL